MAPISYKWNSSKAELSIALPDKIVFDFELNSKDKELFQFITFVFHNLSNDKWYNNNGSNYRIELIKKEKKTNSSLDELEVPNCIKDGMNCEATYGSWCLMMRQSVFSFPKGSGC